MLVEKITQSMVSSLKPKRDGFSHKYTNGYLTAIVGSVEYPGAARLACHGAARVGAGGVQVLIPEALWPLVGSFQPEIMPVLLKQHEDDLVIVDDFEIFLRSAERSKAILLGCGIGRKAATIKFAGAVLSHTDLPCLIDGDGLHALVHLGEDFIKRHACGQWVLTPHQGEFLQLLQAISPGEKNDLSAVSERLNCTILMKGFPTRIYTPDGLVFENTTGNPAASTAGCGDVLSGIIAGYMAQGLSPCDAAKVGIFEAGKAADKIIARTKGHSLMASDIIRELD